MIAGPGLFFNRFSLTIFFFVGGSTSQESKEIESSPVETSGQTSEDTAGSSSPQQALSLVCDE